MTSEILKESEIKSYADRQYWGKKLLVGAWIIEIIAAFIGLMIAWSMGLQTYEVYTKDGSDFPIGKVFDLFLAALPFLMVASVELLKIPFSYLVYSNSDRKIKVVFSVVLLLVTFITFETLLTGFERQYSNITAEVDLPRNELVLVENKLNFKEEELQKLESFTIESINANVSARRQEVEKSKDEDLQNLEDSKSELLVSGNSDLVKQKQLLEEDVQMKIKERDDQVKRLEKLTNDQAEDDNARQKRIRDDNNQQIKDLKEEKRQKENMIMEKEKSLGLFAGMSNDIKKWELRIAKIEKTIDSLTKANSSIAFTAGTNLRNESTKIYDDYAKKIDAIYVKIATLNKKIALNSKFKTEITLIDEKKKVRREKYSNDLKKIDGYRESEEQKLKTKTDRIDVLSIDIAALKDKKLELDSMVYSAYGTTQIYRIARTFYGIERGVRITEEQISFVAKVWFGSLAGIVSTMGIFLAFGAFILKDVTREYKAKRNLRHKSPLKKAIRVMLRALRKRFKEPKIVTRVKEVEVPKEVIKEVPVDKVVIKEVPVEVVKKEVIHIPVYTNDPDMLKFGTPKVKDIMGET